MKARKFLNLLLSHLLTTSLAPGSPLFQDLRWNVHWFGSEGTGAKTGRFGEIRIQEIQSIDFFWGGWLFWRICCFYFVEPSRGFTSNFDEKYICPYMGASITTQWFFCVCLFFLLETQPRRSTDQTQVGGFKGLRQGGFSVKNWGKECPKFDIMMICGLC